MDSAATSGSVPGHAVTAGSVEKRTTNATRLRFASSCFVSVALCSGAAPVAVTFPVVAIVTVNGRMFPPVRAYANPVFSVAPADGTTAAARTSTAKRRFTALSLASVPGVRLVVLASLLFVLAGCGGGSSSSTAQAPDALLTPGKLTATAPATYDAVFHTTAGDFTVTVHRAWAPRGADRFYNLVENGFYDGQRIFRVVPGFVVQWGISGFPEVSSAWQNATIVDDPVKEHNDRGTISFATAGPGTRTTQVFVNLAANRSLDAMGFAPFGKVTSGMDTFGKLYSGYGDRPTPSQQQMSDQGEDYFKATWPKLDTIESATIG